MAAEIGTALRSGILAAALLFGAGMMAGPVMAQAAGDASGGGGPSPDPTIGKTVTEGDEGASAVEVDPSTGGEAVQGEIVEESDRMSRDSEDVARDTERMMRDSDTMTGSREPMPGETQSATVSVPLLWPECSDVRGQPTQMVECLNQQQLNQVARGPQQGSR